MLSDRFLDAVAFAHDLHRQQRRKGRGTPYISHLFAVASLVLDQGGSEEEAIAALLHDAVEDQGGPATREAIRERFGDAVVAIVDGTSDTDQTPKPPWRDRKEAYIAHVESAPASILLVSAADKVSNARSLLAEYRRTGEAIWEHFKGGKDGTLWYYRSLVTAFRRAQPPPEVDELVDELDRLVTEIERQAGDS